MIDKLIGIGIDVGVFYGSNYIAGQGVSKFKPKSSDLVIYGIVDFLVKNGYMDKMWGEEMDKYMAENVGADKFTSRDTLIAILTAFGLTAYDSYKKDKLVLLPPILKAALGQTANVVVDQSFGLTKKS